MKTSIYEGINDAIQPNSIRRQSKVRLNPGVFEAQPHGLDDLRKIGAQEGFSAGDAGLGDPERCRDFCEATELFWVKDIGAIQPIRNLFGQAIDTAQIAAVGHRDTQIRGSAAEAIQKTRLEHRQSVGHQVELLENMRNQRTDHADRVLDATA